MPFAVNNDLLVQSQGTLKRRKKLYWVVGGAGSGKTTICKELSDQYHIPVYDMDAHIYGSYHARFTQERHPVNYQWSTAKNGLAWLLGMSWEEFDSFNQAVLPEYLDLLAEDLKAMHPDASILVDGGICHPAIIARVILPCQIVCLTEIGKSSAEIWQESEERIQMKDFVFQLPEPEIMWRKFLEFDHRITETILLECQENNIPIIKRRKKESVGEFAERVANVMQIGSCKINLRVL